MAKTFRAVAVSTLSNNGQTTPKYNKPVTLNINYDPQGLSVELISGTDPAPGSLACSRQGVSAASSSSTATRLIDHAIAHPGDITTLPTVASAPLFLPLPLLLSSGERSRPGSFATPVDRRSISIEKRGRSSPSLSYFFPSFFSILFTSRCLSLR